MARGRQPATRGVFSFEAALVPPPAVVLDTSFVVHALLPNERLHGPASRFLTGMAEAGSMVVFNRLLELELAETGMQLALKERYGSKRWKDKRPDGRARRRATRLMRKLLQGWRAQLEGFDHARVELHEVADDAIELMALGVSSYDAVHAATAIASGVAAIATVDVGFGAVSQRDLTIFTSNHRLAPTRARRPGPER